MIKDHNKYNIVVVEDNLGDFILLQDYLEETVIAPQIFYFNCYKDFSKFCETDNQFNDVDIVLLDLSLPDKNGEKLIKDVLKIVSNIPVVALTGFSDINFAIKTLSLGVYDYLLKDDLTATILYKSIIYNIERNKNLVQLKESESRYSELFHLSPQPMLVFDKKTLVFLDVNNAAINHYGYTLEEFKKMSILDLTNDDFLFEFDNDQSKAATSQMFCKHQKKNGEIITVDLRSNNIQFNNLEAVVILASDISENLKYIEAIELQNQLLKEIAWTQSHEVRSPLAKILGLIALLDDEKEEDRKEIIEYLQTSAKELDSVISTIVDKSKLVTL